MECEGRESGLLQLDATVKIDGIKKLRWPNGATHIGCLSYWATLLVLWQSTFHSYLKLWKLVERNDCHRDDALDEDGRVFYLF